MNLGRLYRLCRKECRETLRDRRTIGTLLLMPLLLYPILSLVLSRFLLSTASSGPPRYQIVVENEVEGEKLQKLLYLGQPSLDRTGDAGNGADASSPEPILLLGVSGDGPLISLKKGESDLFVKLHGEAPPTIEMFRKRGSYAGAAAAEILQKRIAKANIERLSAQLPDRQRVAEVLVVVREEQIGSKADETPLLATVVPLVLVLMTITGAVYPAIDLTAGERERGTLEAVMASPVSRPALLLAKYFAVVSVALLTAIANLGAMWVTLWSGGFLELLVGSRGLSWGMTFQVLALLVLLACFFAGVLLALTSVARSFKEAQAYLIPIMLLSLAPGVLSLTPDVSLQGIISVIPLVNIVLLSRDVLTDQTQTFSAMVVVLSTVVYALAGIATASQVFGGDALTRGSEQSIGTLFRRPQEASKTPHVAHAAVTMAVLFPAYFVGSSLPKRFADTSMFWRLLWSALVAVLLFGVLPVVSLWLRRVRLQSGLRLHAVPLRVLFPVVLLGISLWVGAHELFLLGEWLGMRGIDLQAVEGVQATLTAWREESVWLILFAFALVPAVFEELTFRGFLFAAISRKGTAAQAIVLTSVAFGLFHVLGAVLTVERLLPSTALGFVLGWVAYRTKSVIPGIVLHAVHNGLLLSVAYYSEVLQQRGIGVEEGAHLPWSWLISGILVASAGFLGLWWGTRTPRSGNPIVA